MYEIDKIKKLAKEQGKSLSFICAQLKTSRTFFLDVERGKSSLKPDRLAQIAEILGTTPEYLRGETDKKEKPDVNIELSEQEKHLIEIIRTLPPKDVNRLEAIAQDLLRLK